MRSTMLALVVALSFPLLVRGQDAKEKKPPELSVIEIEQQLHVRDKKEGKALYRRVLTGVSTDEEKIKLLELYQALARTKPPRGDAGEWTKATGAIVAAAEELVSGKAKDVAALRTAVNCRECHQKHRPGAELAATVKAESGPIATSPPPRFVVVASVANDKTSINVRTSRQVEVIENHEVVVEVEGTGKTEKRQVPVMTYRREVVEVRMPVSYFRLLDVEGKEIKGDEVWKRLTPGAVVLRLVDSTTVDPAYLKLLARDAVILVPTVVPKQPDRE